MSLKIKVNTFNRLKKIRNGIVYESIETVLDELLQNCQRSFKSGIVDNPTIDLIIEDDFLILRDNGIGCEDPQSVLEFETSAWENIPNAFGQGGSESVFQISDYFEIHSLDWKICVDVLKILETGDLDIDPPQSVTFYQGYEVMLRGEKIAANIDQIKAYLESTIKHYPYSCYINGEKVEYEELQTVSSDHIEVLNNKFYSATLGVQTGYNDLQVYFEKRKVTDIWLRGITGIVELKDGAIDLKAPDRKSIISNSKYNEFRQQLREDAKFIYLAFMTKSDHTIFEKYVDNIDEYLAPSDYIDYLPSDMNDVQYIRKETLEKEIPNVDTVKTVDNLKIDINYHNIGDYLPATPGKEIPGEVKVFVPNKAEIKHKFKDDVKDAVNYAWVEKINQEKFVEIIAQLEEFNIKVLTSKNKLYDKAFRFMKIPHVSEIADRTESRWEVGSPSMICKKKDPLVVAEKRSRDKEQRLLGVLGMIEAYYGLQDVFRIADVKEHILIKDNDRTVVDTTAKTSFAPIKDKGQIYLDRESLNLNKLTVDKSTAAVTKFDVLVILVNVNTIANGLANIIYNSINGTVAHYRYVEKISKEIAMLLASF